jgi:hypothetical protein
MSIRFECNACRTVLKLGEMITEKKKVRCTGCGLVLLVSPNPNDPMSVTATIPQKTSQSRRPISLSRQQLGMLGSVLVAVVALILILWWAFKLPSDRGGIEGNVTVDGAPVEQGTVTLEPEQGRAVTVKIENGRFRITPKSGPPLGKYRVRISSKKPTGRQVHKEGGQAGEMVDEIVESIAPEFNEKTTIDPVEIQVGSITRDFTVTLRPGAPK